MTVAFSSGLNFNAPSAGETATYSVLAARDAKISAHDHTGAGLGTQIAAGAIAANAVGGPAIRLANNVALRARNAAGSADVNMMLLDASNLLELPTAFRFSSTETVTTSTALSLTTTISVLNGASLATTLAAGAAGQLKLVLNVASTTATVTPSVTSGANTVSIGQRGFALLCYVVLPAGDSEWRVIAGTKSIVSDDIETFAAAGTWTGFSRGITCTGTTYTITTPAGATGQTVVIQNNASGAVTFGGLSCATTTCYLYTYTGAAWKRVALA